MVEDVARYHTLYEMAIKDALPDSAVTFATDGAGALERLTTPDTFDLVVLDLNIPKVSGEEVLRTIRQNHALDNMPVIILTGDTSHETQSRLLEAGADDFIEKGSSPQVFAARLKAQTRHKLALDRVTRMAIDMDIFASGVLHDIRNIETTMLALCDLIRMQVQEDCEANKSSILQDIGSLRDQANRIGTYAANVIDRVRQTREQPNLEPLSIEDILRWVGEMLSTQSVVAKEATLEFAFPDKLLPVIGDRHLLRLALLNICQNAVKYRRDGVPAKITVRQHQAEGRSSEDKRIVTCLRDNGQGVRAEDLRKIFEPFYRGVEARRKGGFGLGLALVTRVITNMRGQVWAETPQDDQGPGTAICFELPTP